MNINHKQPSIQYIYTRWNNTRFSIVEKHIRTTRDERDFKFWCQLRCLLVQIEHNITTPEHKITYDQFRNHQEKYKQFQAICQDYKKKTFNMTPLLKKMIAMFKIQKCIFCGYQHKKNVKMKKHLLLCGPNYRRINILQNHSNRIVIIHINDNINKIIIPNTNTSSRFIYSDTYQCQDIKMTLLELCHFLTVTHFTQTVQLIQVKQIKRVEQVKRAENKHHDSLTSKMCLVM